MPSIPQSNALSEASQSSVQDLFNRNPSQNTQADIDRLIAYYRQLRENIASTGTIRHTRVKKEELLQNVDLSDL